MAIPSTISYDRSQAVSFSEISMVEYHSAMYSYPRFLPDILGILKPFTFEVEY